MWVMTSRMDRCSVFITILKKGDLIQCDSYRAIALISHASKILLHVILESMQFNLEGEFGQEQAGFRLKRYTCYRSINLQFILEKAKERTKSL